MKNINSINNMKKCLIPLVFLPLYGCIPAALVVGATAGGAIVYDKRDLATLKSDQHSANIAQYWIDTDPQLKGRSKISVSVFNEIGLLVGQAQTTELRDRAYELMQKAQGTRRIYNAITIAAPLSDMHRASDAWVTSKVKTVLLAQSGLQSNDIKVVTEDGVVYLLGSIARDQADIATDAVRHVDGVTRVVKVFEYT